MTLPPASRVVLRCPNQHEFEIDMFDPQLLAVQRFVCELCGANFSVDGPSPNFSQHGAQAASRK